MAEMNELKLLSTGLEDEDGEDEDGEDEDGRVSALSDDDAI
jgi:hypothetical protein